MASAVDTVPGTEDLDDALAPLPVPAPAPAKTREDKLWDLHVRKVRMAAVALDGKPLVGGGERRFFEWGTGTAGEVRAWVGSGKWGGKKLERAWVPVVRCVLCAHVSSD